MTPSEKDPDEAILQERYPKLKRVSEKVKISSGPFKGEPTIIGRRLTEQNGVLFTLKYDDGRIREQEWFD